MGFYQNQALMSVTESPMMDLILNSSAIDKIHTCLCNLKECDMPNLDSLILNVPFLFDHAYKVMDNIIRDNNLTCPNNPFKPPAILTDTKKYALMVLFFVTVALSIIGNVTVICVLTCGSRRKREFSMFLLNLAIADWTLAIFSMPFAFMNAMLNEWVFGDVMCPITAYIKKISECVSIFTLTAIGIDRYYAVMYPLKNRMSTSRPKIIIAGIWSISLSLSLVKPIVSYTRTFWLDKNTNNTLTVCKEWWPNRKLQIVYELTLFITTYIIPLTILSFTYTKVALKLWGRSLPGNADKGRDATHRKSKKKTIKMLLSIVVLYALCWMPFNLFYLVTLFNGATIHDYYQQEATVTAYLCVLTWIAMTDSFINPLIYVFLNDGFREDLKRFCRRVCKFGMAPERRNFNPSLRMSMSCRSTLTRTTRQRTTIQDVCSVKDHRSLSVNTFQSLKTNGTGAYNTTYEYKSASRSTSFTSETIKTLSLTLDKECATKFHATSKP
ncbi:substance-K receptor-like [Ptychodera flava]|uniref:substance-K receptor-like n=1 Tax=Ptychodera flava TaxID=63121 RepID=UPI003969D0E9